MKAVVLAAGTGYRLRPLTRTTSKSLLKIKGKTILEYILSTIVSENITEVAIVVGYYAEQIKKVISDIFPNLHTTFIYNDDFASTNTSYSLFLAKKFIGNSAFFKINGDVIFQKEVVNRLLKNAYPNGVCVRRSNSLTEEEVKVTVNNNGFLTDIGKHINPTLAVGESVGIEKFGEKASKEYFNVLTHLMKDAQNHSLFYDDVVKLVIQKKLLFKSVEISDLVCMEIDTKQDYTQAKKLFK